MRKENCCHLCRPIPHDSVWFLFFRITSISICHLNRKLEHTFIRTSLRFMHHICIFRTRVARRPSSLTQSVTFPTNPPATSVLLSHFNLRKSLNWITISRWNSSFRGASIFHISSERERETGFFRCSSKLKLNIPVLGECINLTALRVRLRVRCISSNQNEKSTKN